MATMGAWSVHSFLSPRNQSETLLARVATAPSMQPSTPAHASFTGPQLCLFCFPREPECTRWAVLGMDGILLGVKLQAQPLLSSACTPDRGVVCVFLISMQSPGRIHPPHTHHPGRSQGHSRPSPCSFSLHFNTGPCMRQPEQLHWVLSHQTLLFPWPVVLLPMVTESQEPCGLSRGLGPQGSPSGPPVPQCLEYFQPAPLLLLLWMDFESIHDNLF